MLKLRAFTKSDASAIEKWITDERMCYLWSADRYGHYPVTATDINIMYAGSEKDGNFYPLMAYDDEEGLLGHLIVRYPSPEDRTTVRFGFIIVNYLKRGRGYGGAMLREAFRFAFETLGAERITLGVFQNNTPAILCYLKAGFHKPTDPNTPEFYKVPIMGEEWICCNLEINKDDILQ